MKKGKDTHLLRGNPIPRIPAHPVSSTLVFVSLMAAKYWLFKVGRERAKRFGLISVSVLSLMDRIARLSVPMTPNAWVPVWESP